MFVSVDLIGEKNKVILELAIKHILSYLSLNVIFSDRYFVGKIWQSEG